MSTPSPPAPRIPGLEHVRRLGAGGFADVHLYRQELPRMLVAVKVLRTAAGDLREQLVAEANTMAELAEHPYIVTVLRADVTDDGRPYLVMAYYPGTSLAARARRSPLSVAETLRAGVQLASAVETAHRAGCSTATSSRPTCCSPPTAPRARRLRHRRADRRGRRRGRRRRLRRVGTPRCCAGARTAPSPPTSTR
ncbi:protein kinase [Janibacter melonis]|uniref:protein kinase n=1 Tax=Janibacter melonis TaxID=262209 RepID=UPI002095D24F|nr:protein kinase [Janibacter melonis]